MTNTLRLSRLAPAGLLLGLLLVACGGSNNNTGTNAAQSATTTMATQTPPTSGPAAATTATTTAAATAAKVNANTASQGEITAALDAAGVPNASRWAGEVVEYRPYPTNDPDLAKLRQNLAKYNPGAGVVDKIVSALSV